MSVTFDGVTLQKPLIQNVTYRGSSSSDKLLDGTEAVNASTNYGFAVTFRCYTASFADITNLIAKYGTSGTLAVGATNYTACKLVGDVSITPIQNYSAWFYTFTIMKDTT